MSKDLTSAFAAGLLSGVLFLVIFGIGLGFLFMFLPTLPIFYVGLRGDLTLSRLTICVGTALVALTSELASALLYLFFLALPAGYFAKKSLLTAGKGADSWYPLGLITLDLSLYASAFIALMTTYYAGSEGGLPALISNTIRQAFTDFEGEYGGMIEVLAESWSFLVFPVTFWLWGIMLYGHGWLATRLLKKNNLQRRPEFSVQPFTLPGWLLTLLVICALASLIGSDSMRFLGKSALICLMLPYFFSGAALMQEFSKSWPSNRIFLFFIYFMVFSQFWPALIISGIGLWNQIKHLSRA
jgi:hypothetical protein